MYVDKSLGLFLMLDHQKVEKKQCRKSGFLYAYIPPYTSIYIQILPNSFIYLHVPPYTLKY